MEISICMCPFLPFGYDGSSYSCASSLLAILPYSVLPSLICPFYFIFSFLVALSLSPLLFTFFCTLLSILSSFLFPFDILTFSSLSSCPFSLPVLQGLRCSNPLETFLSCDCILVVLLPGFPLCFSHFHIFCVHLINHPNKVNFRIMIGLDVRLSKLPALSQFFLEVHCNHISTRSK